MLNEAAKTLIGIGFLLMVAGVLLSLFGKIPGLGKLPGDWYFRKGDFTFYFPLATCLLLSLVLTAILNLSGKK